MIRDRLVVGIRDTGLSERLQLDCKLTLEKAKKAAKRIVNQDRSRRNSQIRYDQQSKVF